MMCLKLCCLYVGSHAKQTQCEFCSHLQYHENGKAVCHFSYLPVIPCLYGYFECKSMVEGMEYQKKYMPTPGEMSDVLDRENYKELMGKFVITDGNQLNHKFF